MRRALLIVVCIVSLAGWGAYFYTLAGSSQTEQRISDEVLSRMEERRKVEDSLKQDLEMQKRNAMLLRQQEFERELESSGQQFREQMKQAMQEWYADVQGNAAKQQEEQTARDEAFRKKTEGSLSAFFESMRAEIKRNEAAVYEQVSRQAEGDAKRLEEAKAEFLSRMQGIVSAREKEQSLFREEREKDRRELQGLGARLAELEQLAGQLRVQVKELQKTQLPEKSQGG